MAKITPDEALQRLASQTTDKRRAKTVLEFVRPIGDRDDALYVFRNGGNATITTSDSDLAPVIAECSEADFTLDLPPCLEDWLDGYVSQVEWWQSIGSTLTADTPDMEEEPRKDVPSLIDSVWGQGTPWNDNLDFGGGKCLTGCTATASAQVIRYWGKKGWHRGCTATAAYTTKTNKYKVAALPPITKFDFANMPTGKPKTAQQIDAVATICQYVGEAFACDYAPGATGAYTDVVAARMKDHFRMGKGVRLIYASNGYAAWERQVYANIADGMPVLMSGGGSKGRHMFVCDGYNAGTDRYHFNWGWSGSYDGWYAMTALNPKAGYTFNDQKRTVVGIRPDYKLGDVNRDGDVTVADVMAVADHVLNGSFSESADVNSDSSVTVTDAAIVVDKALGKDTL